MKLLEARLDNAVYRLGIAPSRPAARQLVAHKHITVNGGVVNIPSFQLKPGDIISFKEKDKTNESLNRCCSWQECKIRMARLERR